MEALVEAGIEVAAVITNPDRHAGRGMDLHPSPVKVRALELGLNILQPINGKDPVLLEQIEALAPDVAVVVAYGSILPTPLLDAVPHGFINVHFSLLPAYRGAAPVQRALMDNQLETGVAIMVLTPGMDEGPILALEATAIDPNETAGELGARLALVGGPLLARTLPAFVAGDIEPEPQDDSLATYAAKISSDDARIDWSRAAEETRNLIRGVNPAPGAWSIFRDHRLKIHAATALESESPGPGRLVRDDDLVVGTGAGTLRLEVVQPAGKKPMAGAEFVRGIRPEEGERFE